MHDKRKSGFHISRRGLIALAGGAAAGTAIPYGAQAVGRADNAPGTLPETDIAVANGIYDPLTGLPDEALFLDRVASAERLLRMTPSGYEPKLSVIVVTINNLDFAARKVGNHPKAKLVMEMVIARRLERTLHDIHTLARLGEGEFAVLTVGDELIRTGWPRMQRLLSLPMRLLDHEIVLSTSNGAASKYPSKDPDFDMVLAARTAARRIARPAFG